MSMTITLDDDLVAKLECAARIESTGVQEFAIGILTEALEDTIWMTPEQLVAKVRATPPNPMFIRKATAIPVEHVSLETGVTFSQLESSNLEMISLEKFVAKVRAMPPNPNSIRPATGDLAEHLRSSPIDPNFDVEAWNREWSAIEAEMKAITRANDIAEGRG